MAKKSGSKSSRSERRAGRKRAERAVEHGLPARQQPPRARPRVAAVEPGRNREGSFASSDAPPASVTKSSRVPTLVKVLGGALVILIGVYLLSRQRDQALTENKPAAEPLVVAAPVAPAAEAAEPGPLPSPPVVNAQPQPPSAAVVSVTPPTAPVVVAPVASAPSKPKVEKTRLAPPPAVVAVAPPAAVPAPAAAPAAATPPKPAIPKAQPTVPPVDNPY